MPMISPVKLESANPEQNQILESILLKLGRIPNIYATMAHSPNTLETMLACGAGLKNGLLTSKEIEAIALAVGQKNGCDYCVAAHTVIGKVSGLSQQETIDFRKGLSVDQKMDTLIKLAVEIVETRGRPAQVSIDAFKQSGYSDAVLIEVIAWVSYNIFTNYFNHITDPECDFPKPPDLV